MLLGYHLLWSTTANIVGSPEQADRFQKLIISNNYFIGGAVNPRDSDLSIKSDGDGLVFNGFKFFNTGGVVSDLTVLEGVYEGTGNHIFAFAKTDQPGIQFGHDWNNIGLRLTESGSVKISDVRVPWADALGWNIEKKEPDPRALQIPFATLLLPTIQLVFSNFYLGIALGAQQYAARYTLKGTRAWPFGGDVSTVASTKPVTIANARLEQGESHRRILHPRTLRQLPCPPPRRIRSGRPRRPGSRCRPQ